MGIFREKKRKIKISKILKIVNTFLLQVLFLDSLRSYTQTVSLSVVIGELN